MPLNPGARLGSYEILVALGAGGMGEVYRARDTKLGRDIAIKILPSGFVHDQDRIARFRREAQLLAALNHTHIAAIHGIEDAEGTLFLVLELVEGETLADRLKQGPLPLVDALAIARQVADALEAAHEKGIVHRDLKPANIALTADGHVKVLDFGLAKATDPNASAAELSMSPTISIAATQAGVILGTAAYMSPEQAKGRPTDKRTDVWAFGCVLYEMLTGTRPFEGEDITDIIAAVVRAEPDWGALPADVPEQIRLLVKRCLDKDRRKRVSDFGVVRFLLTETLPAPAPTADVAGTIPSASNRRGAVMAGLGLIAGILVASLGTWALMRSGPTAAPLPVRFSIVPPAKQALAVYAVDRDLAISPDGSSIVYRVNSGGQPQLAIQSLADLEPRLLANTVNARSPFFSSDNGWIGFFGDGSLKKVPASGGPALPICKYTGAPRGASWGPDDTIVFATAGTSEAGGLFSVAAGGGEPGVLTKADTAQGENGHWFPSILPGGRAVLFTVAVPGSMDNASLAVLDLTTGKTKTLLRGGSQPEYVTSGHLVYRSAGTLRSVRFDLARLEVLSDPIAVVDQTSPIASGAGQFSISRTGTLAYVAGATSAAFVSRSLVWVTRQGKEEPIAAPEHGYALARISPDGTRIAVDLRDRGGGEIWIWDLVQSNLAPLSLEAESNNMLPLWMPDGSRVVWTGGTAANLGLVWQFADGTGKMEKIAGTESAAAPFATSAVRDGPRILFFQGAATGHDIRTVTMGADSAPKIETLIQTRNSEINPELSPNGRWLAYQSIRSGRNEIWVCPFPNVEGGLWQISTSGGSRPLWSRDGSELYYLDSGNFLTAVRVEAKGSAFTLGKTTKLLSTAYYPGSSPRGIDLRSYDVAADGRFLMVKEAGQDSQSASQSPTITVVLNWSEELKAKLPAP